jgi:hypothetical protein
MIRSVSCWAHPGCTDKDACTQPPAGPAFNRRHNTNDYGRISKPIWKKSSSRSVFTGQGAALKPADALGAKVCGRAPDTVEALVRIAGRRPQNGKMVVALGFGKTRICVDVHVHRITNRLGCFRPRPFETEIGVEAASPTRYWKTGILTGRFGQTRCARAIRAASVARLRFLQRLHNHGAAP